MLAESHALVVRNSDQSRGLASLENHLDGDGENVVWADRELTRAAVQNWLRPYRDKRWSLCDAVSFEVMTRQGIQEAFAFDEHFEQAGFTLV